MVGPPIQRKRFHCVLRKHFKYTKIIFVFFRVLQGASNLLLESCREQLSRPSASFSPGCIKRHIWFCLQLDVASKISRKFWAFFILSISHPASIFCNVDFHNSGFAVLVFNTGNHSKAKRLPAWLFSEQDTSATTKVTVLEPPPWIELFLTLW